MSWNSLDGAQAPARGDWARVASSRRREQGRWERVIYHAQRFADFTLLVVPTLLMWAGLIVTIVLLWVLGVQAVHGELSANSIPTAIGAVVGAATSVGSGIWRKRRTRPAAP
jgi:hypothetical protein